VNNQNWYSIVVRGNPDVVLVIDRSLTRAWVTVRMMFPEIGPEHLAFRTLSEKEVDSL